MAKHIYLLIFSLVTSPLQALDGSNTPRALSNWKSNMKTIPSYFENIAASPFEPFRCSPDVSSDWDYRGIKLNAPQKVIVSNYYVMPLCGAHKYSMKFLNKFDTHLLTKMIIVVTDLDTHKSYSGKLIHGERGFEKIEKMTGTDEELESTTSTSYFNVDLYSYISGLPERPGKYLIYATINEVKSNTVEVEIEVADGAEPGPRPLEPNF